MNEVAKKFVINKIHNHVKSYYKAQYQMTTINKLLLSSKATLKNVQQLHWNHKELREDKDFSNLYKNALETYTTAKKKYKILARVMKHNKDMIKELNRELARIEGKYNGEKLF